MNFSKNIEIHTPLIKHGPERKNYVDLAKKNYQMLRKKQIDAIVEFTRNEIVDRYYDLDSNNEA